MNKLTVILKESCQACKNVMDFLNSLTDECKDQIGILDEQTSSMSDLYKILDSYDTSGFPTFILHGKPSYDGHDTIISGFTKDTEPLLLKHVAC